MAYFQSPYGGGQPDICLGPDGTVVNIPEPEPIPVTFNFTGNNGAGTPFQGQPMANLSFTPLPLWGMNLIAIQKMRGPVPAVEG